MKKVAAALAGLTACCFASACDARPWKPGARDLAIDYAQIVDNRSPTEIAIVMWLVPQLVEELSPAAAEMLNDYVIVGVVHMSVDSGGTASFADVPTLEPRDGDGAPLRPLSEEVMPPALAGAMTGIRAAIRQSLGQMGQGMHFFAFEAGSVRACASGRLSIPFAEETSTFDTPIPGCSP